VTFLKNNLSKKIAAKVVEVYGGKKIEKGNNKITENLDNLFCSKIRFPNSSF
jgi:hypothetical protein